MVCNYVGGYRQPPIRHKPPVYNDCGPGRGRRIDFDYRQRGRVNYDYRQYGHRQQIGYVQPQCPPNFYGYNGGNCGNYGYGNYGYGINPEIYLATKGMEYAYKTQIIRSIPDWIEAICNCIRGFNGGGHDQAEPQQETQPSSPSAPNNNSGPQTSNAQTASNETVSASDSAAKTQGETKAPAASQSAPTSFYPWVA
jgi:hypothetical protein